MVQRVIVNVQKSCKESLTIINYQTRLVEDWIGLSTAMMGFSCDAFPDPGALRTWRKSINWCSQAKGVLQAPASHRALGNSICKQWTKWIWTSSDLAQIADDSEWNPNGITMLQSKLHGEKLPFIHWSITEQYTSFGRWKTSSQLGGHGQTWRNFSTLSSNLQACLSCLQRLAKRLKLQKTKEAEASEIWKWWDVCWHLNWKQPYEGIPLLHKHHFVAKPAKMIWRVFQVGESGCSDFLHSHP